MKIIVVDDSEVDIRMLKAYVKKIISYHPHLQACYFKNAEDALKEILKNNVALIICDQSLGRDYDMNGLDLADRVRQEMPHRDYPFLCISASRIDEEQAQQSGTYFMDKEHLASKFVDFCVNILSQRYTSTGLMNLQEALENHKQESKENHLVVIKDLTFHKEVSDDNHRLIMQDLKVQKEANEAMLKMMEKVGADQEKMYLEQKRALGDRIGNFLLAFIPTPLRKLLGGK